MFIPLDLLMIAALIVGILLGYPVSFTISGVAALFAVLGWVTGQFDISLLGAVAQRMYGVVTNPVLIAIPLFVFMGLVLEKSKIAEELLQTMGQLFGRIRGGLGVSVVLVGALLAASTGIVGATVIAMGLIALPTMLRNKYDPRLGAGLVCTAGTLGQIIPPSTLLIILSDVVSNAHQQAQFAQGKFTIDSISVGQVFSAALLPGLLLVSVYCVYVLIRANLNPNIAPAVNQSEETPPLGVVLNAIVPPILLIVAVLGSILGGVASPTEAASVGAIGALLMAGARSGTSSKIFLIGAIALVALALAAGLAPVRLQRSDATGTEFFLGGLYALAALIGSAAVALALRESHRSGALKPALSSTTSVTSMIFATILMASVFSLVFVGLGGEERIEHFITQMPGGATGALVFAMLLIFVLGFFMDFVEITVIVLPLVLPILIGMGHDPIWLAVLVAINLQTSFLTPPFGFSLFYLRGAAPKEITTWDIYQGVAPFVLLQIIAVALIWSIPTIATSLPRVLF